MKTNISQLVKFAEKDKLYASTKSLQPYIIFRKIQHDHKVVHLEKAGNKGLKSHSRRDVCYILEISACLE